MGSVFKLLMLSATALFASLVCLLNYSSSVVYDAKPISLPDEQQPLVSNAKPNNVPGEQQPLAKQTRELSVEQWNAAVRETMAQDARAERERTAQEITDPNARADRETTRTPSNRIQELIAQAEQGNADSAYNLGKRYWIGEGIDRDYSEALAWFALAAGLGHARAPFGVGRCHQEGKGVALDVGEAAEWYREGAERGDGRAYDRLWSLVRQGKVSDTYMEGLVDIHRAMSERDSGTFKNEEDVVRFRGQQLERQQRESSRIATEQRNIARSRQDGSDYYRRQSENATTQEGRNYWNKLYNRQIDSRDRDMRNVR